MTCEVEGCSNPGTLGAPELCVKHKFQGGKLRVNGLHRFRNDRKMGMTQAQRGREFRADAEAKGKAEKFQYVGRERTPTEVYRNGRWEPNRG